MNVKICWYLADPELCGPKYLRNRPGISVESLGTYIQDSLYYQVVSITVFLPGFISNKFANY
jgi:hypothetical protein